MNAKEAYLIKIAKVFSRREQAQMRAEMRRDALNALPPEVRARREALMRGGSLQQANQASMNAKAAPTPTLTPTPTPAKATTTAPITTTAPATTTHTSTPKPSKGFIGKHWGKMAIGAGLVGLGGLAYAKKKREQSLEQQQGVAA
jgi:cell division septation protein DedD